MKSFVGLVGMFFSSFSLGNIFNSMHFLNVTGDDLAPIYSAIGGLVAALAAWLIGRINKKK